MITWDVKDRALFQAALDKWGDDAQWIMLLEEMAELQVEICHLRRGRGSMAHVRGEIADVAIMLGQAAEMMDGITNGRNVLRLGAGYGAKMFRLADRIGGDACDAYYDAITNPKGPDAK